MDEGVTNSYRFGDPNAGEDLLPSNIAAISSTSPKDQAAKGSGGIK